MTLSRFSSQYAAHPGERASNQGVSAKLARTFDIRSGINLVATFYPGWNESIQLAY